MYNINCNKILELCCRYLDKNFNKKFIRVNCFQIVVFVFFVKKFENRFRFYINYKILNSIIVKNKYSLFLIFKTLNCFSRVKIFIKLNIIFEFNRLYIWKEKKILLFFAFFFEFFIYLIIFFELYNRFVYF